VNELLPCPLCQKTDGLVIRDSYNSTHYLECRNCGILFGYSCKLVRGIYEGDICVLIEDWNERLTTEGKAKQ